MIDRYAEHRKQPLSEHIADWEKSMTDKGGTAKHAKQSAQRVRAVFDGCRFAFWPGISASKVQSWLSDLRKDGVSIQTSNYYRQACQGFCAWTVRDGRASENPLAHLSSGNAQTDRRHVRRALVADELRQLLATTRTEPERFGMDGPGRAWLFRLACETGLRANELRSLTPASFDLDSPDAHRDRGGRILETPTRR